jgi:uncharacterized protein
VKSRLFPPCVVASPCRAGSATAGLRLAWRKNHRFHFVVAFGETNYWLESAIVEAATGVRFTLMPMVIASYLRLVTSSEIFAKPTAIKDAINAVDKILSEPGVVLATLGVEWPAPRERCTAKNLSGNDLPDAWLAAATTHVGEHLVAFDRDFKKLLPRSQLTVLLDPNN